MATVLHTRKFTETTGSETTVNVVRLSVRQLYDAARLLGAGDTLGLVELSTGRPAPLLDLLPDEAVAELVRLCIDEALPRITTISGTDPNLAALVWPFFKRSGDLAGGLPAVPLNPPASISPAPTAQPSAH